MKKFYNIAIATLVIVGLGGIGLVGYFAAKNTDILNDILTDKDYDERFHQHYSNLGTKSPHRMDILNDAERSKELRDIIGNATSVHAFYRHGSRFPMEKTVKRAERFVEKLKKSKKEDEPDFDVTLPFDASNESKLSERGEEEMKKLGELMKSFFNAQTQAITDDADGQKFKDKFLFKSSNEDRAFDSMDNFIIGANLNQSKVSKNREVSPKEDNYSWSNTDFLQFYDRCCQNNKTKDQKQSAKDNLIEAFGVQIDEPTGEDTAQDDYIKLKTCAAAVLVNKDVDHNQLKTDENYKNLGCSDVPADKKGSNEDQKKSSMWHYPDLKHYNQEGYNFNEKLYKGHFYKAGFVVLKQFLKRINETVTDVSQDNTETEKSSFFFSHSQALMALMTLLDVPMYKFALKKIDERDFAFEILDGKTENLVAFEQTANQIKNRTAEGLDFEDYTGSTIPKNYFWNTTDLAPMAGNFMFVLNSKKKEAHFVVNEEVVGGTIEIPKLVQFLNRKMLSEEERKGLCDCQ